VPRKLIANVLLSRVNYLIMKLILTLLLFLCFSYVQAQQKAPGLPQVENLQDFYRTGVGLRVGWPIAALTFKHFIKKRTALEFIAAPHFGGAYLTTLVEFHTATRRDGVYWYYGLGVDAGVFDGSKYKDYQGNSFDERSVTSIGLSAIVGIEKNIHETPFSIGVDLKPKLGIYNAGGSVIEGAVSLKYIWSW
jgi:hypothetical protein